MTLGRQGERQTELMAGRTELLRLSGHAFSARLQAVLVVAGFDRLGEMQCKRYYADRLNCSSLPPRRYLRMHLANQGDVATLPDMIEVIVGGVGTNIEDSVALTANEGHGSEPSQC